MRLLILAADYFPPFRVDVKVLFGEQLAARGVDIDWILQSAKPLERPITEAYGSGVVWVGASSKPESPRLRAKRLIQSVWHDFSVLRVSRKNTYDVIQVKDKFIGGLLGLIAARRSGAKFVYWLSYPFPEAQKYTARESLARYPWINHIRGALFDFLLYRVLLPRSDFIFVQSEQMRRDVASRGISPEKMKPIPMGVTPDLLSWQASSLPAASPTIAYLGTMNPIRRIDFVIRVFAQVLRRNPDAKLLMIGGPDDALDPLKNLAAELQIANAVSFTGNMEQQEALELTCTAQVCLSPFYPTPVLNSTSPTKIVEYMALGLPVVANHHPEMSKIILDSNAGICVDYDEEAFAAAIIKLLDNPLEAKMMGERGRNFAETRSYALIADDLYSDYRSICGSGA